MRNWFVLFDVAMKIARKQFYSSKKDAEKISFSVSKSHVANEGIIIVTMLFQPFKIIMPLPVSLVFEKTLLEVIIATMLSKWYKYSI